MQGVYFRVSAQRQALALRLTGYVLNEADGSVLAEAEGETEQVQAFIAWCHRGPPGARVTEVLVEEDSIRGYTGFDIRQRKPV